MKISFGSWAFIFGPHARTPLNLGESARRIAAAGYDGIEISGFPPQLTLDTTAGERAEAMRILSDLGLGVSGYAPDFTMVNPLIERNRERYLDNARKALDLCAEMGSPSIRVDTIAAPGSLPDIEYGAASRRLADLWREAAEFAAERKVHIVWEFEPGFVFNKPSEVVEIYERVGHPSFQILFDLSHAYMCGVAGARQQGEVETLAGGVGGFLELLSGRIGHLHVVDSDGTLYGEETSTHCPFGEGLIAFDQLGPKLRGIPGLAWWCVDLSFRSDQDRVLRSSLEFVRKLSS
ncbi:MAG: sugar phosphate isomerase/epimerase [Bryobacterales bacterium]|nr:sugar phosphate isomerase/epimerase [Bryobacterales bacterium]